MATWTAKGRDVSGREGEQGASSRPGTVLDAFDQYYRDVHGYLARRVDAHTAEDLASETFARALEHRARFDPAKGGERAWLFGIATNLLAKHRRSEVRGYRAHARLGADPLTRGRSDLDEVDARVDAQAHGRALAGALAELRDEERDVLLLVAHAQMSYGEVAQALDLPVGTVRSRLHRARGRVRAALERADMRAAVVGPCTDDHIDEGKQS